MNGVKMNVLIPKTTELKKDNGEHKTFEEEYLGVNKQFKSQRPIVYELNHLYQAYKKKQRRLKRSFKRGNRQPDIKPANN